MDPALRLQPGQEELTTAQYVEARRFAQAYTQAQLSTEPVDEQETEQLLRQVYEAVQLPPPQQIQWVNGPFELIAERLVRQAYAVAQLPPPQQIQWMGGPLELIAVLAQLDVWVSVENAPKGRYISSADTLGGKYDDLREQLRSQLEESVGEEDLWNSIEEWVGTFVEFGIWQQVGEHISSSIWDSIWDSVGKRIGETIWVSLDPRHRAKLLGRIDARLRVSADASARAYHDADELATCCFFHEYLSPNELRALCQFNERVSGYWLDKEHAVIVRRPRVLARDQRGGLHSETGKCVEYHDGWGFYAWHGVRVPEKVILAPETLTRQDWREARNVEMRRVMQERMGQRFVPELGGQVIDNGPHGMLYEVRLPEVDPEGVARYVQVQDASTQRQYFVRVPPSIQTAAEAVAWSFGLSVEEYHPADET